MSNKTNKEYGWNYWKLAQIVSSILCLVGFVLNSLAIFENFIEGKKVTSNELQRNDKLLFPSITMCSLSGYKEEMDEFSDLDLENFLNKTTYLDEILWDVYVDETYYDVDEMYGNETLWNVSTTYSYNKGRCHTIQYKEEVNSKSVYLKYFL